MIKLILAGQHLYVVGVLSICIPGRGRLRSFHWRVVRYMTGEHIQKGDRTWEYLDNEELEIKCELFDV